MTEFLKKNPKRQHLSTVPKTCSNIKSCQNVIDACLSPLLIPLYCLLFINGQLNGCRRKGKTDCKYRFIANSYEIVEKKIVKKDWL